MSIATSTDEPLRVDIALIGSGSANSLPGPEFADLTIAQIDAGLGPDDRFGGTCLNVGCIPTKMFVHTADLALVPSESARFGLDERLDAVHWWAIRDRIFGRIDPISEGGEEYRADHDDNANLTLLRGRARFVGPKELEVALTAGGTRRVIAQQVVIGAGSRPAMPPVAGLLEATPLTSDTVMRLDELPGSMLILGSGVIAVEMAHVLSALGVDITLIARTDRVLRSADEQVSARLTEVLADRIDLALEVAPRSVRRTGSGIELVGERGGETVTFAADDLLVATGRTPNGDLLDVPAEGIGMDRAGRIAVDAHQRVLDPHGHVLDGVWALGDVSSPIQLKHVANHQLRVLRHNMLHPEDLLRSDTMPVPAGVFTHPQVAWVGLREQEARELAERTGREVRVAIQDYAGIAYGWALEDTTGFAKLIVDAETTEILGAHIIGPEATALIQVLIQAMSTGQTARDIARTQYWIHPALPELIENALLQVID